MIDIRLIYVQDVLPVIRIARLADFSPPTLRLTGEDFNSVHSVFINDVKAPDIVPESGTSLLVALPDIVQGQLLKTLTVTSHKFTQTQRKSLISFAFDPARPSVSGIERLVQLFVKVMLQSPSTYSNLGGGFLKAFHNGDADPQTKVADLNLSVSRTRRQIMAQQAASPSIPLGEQLQDARLLHSEFNPGKLSLTGSIAIDNRLGKTAVAGLGV